ncbi:DUF3830 family protein [Sphingomonas oligophenolica]|uniref:DUF3830 family protein n=1 Tax=Sphingomonas oligophenolica TaxID=301154 RepID=A0ABU9YBT3_9SPHN
MSDVLITTGDLRFVGRLEREQAPQTCRYFEAQLPYTTKFIHSRWSGEGCWVPMGDEAMPFGFENATSYPAPGQMIFYPGGYSETEILLAYGGVSFASKLGQLAGNHFLTIVEGLEQLPVLGKRTLWQGAQELLIESLV